MELSGYSHAQRERIQSEWFQRSHLHIAVAGLSGEDQASKGDVLWWEKRTPATFYLCSCSKVTQPRDFRVSKGVRLPASVQMTAARTNTTGLILSETICRRNCYAQIIIKITLCKFYKRPYSLRSSQCYYQADFHYRREFLNIFLTPPFSMSAVFADHCVIFKHIYMLDKFLFKYTKV